MLFASRRSVVHLPISRVTTTIMAANHHWTPSAYPYPSARRSDASTVYASKAHGQVVVPEPYDWLETPPSQSSETAAWTKAQSEYTARFVAQCKDKPALQERLKLNWDYARTSAPSLKPDGRYYYSYNAGLAPPTAASTWPTVSLRADQTGSGSFCARQSSRCCRAAKALTWAETDTCRMC